MHISLINQNCTTHIYNMFVLISFAMITTFNLMAVEMSYKSYTQEDGVPSEKTFSIIEDDIGYLWIATRSGLIRFNGHEFTEFTNQENSPGKYPISIAKAPNGNLWVSTWGNGVTQYDPKTEKFTQYIHDPSKPESLGSNISRKILTEQNSHIWISTYGAGLSLYMPDSDSFINFTHDPNNLNSLSTNFLTTISSDTNGNILIGMQNGKIDLLNPKTGKVTHFPQQIQQKSSNNYIRSIIVNNNNQAWVASDTGLQLLNINEKKYLPREEWYNALQGRAITSMIKRSKGGYWVGDSNGLYIFNPFEKSLTKITDISPNGEKNKIRRVWGLFEAHDNTLWVATLEGVAHFSSNYSRFERIGPELSSLKNKYPMAVGLEEDSNGYIWVLTKSKGLQQYDPSTKKLTKELPAEANSILIENHPHSLIIDHKDNIWVGTNTGIFKYSITEGKLAHAFKHDANNPKSIPGNVVKVIEVDNNNNLWAGILSEGVIKLSPEYGVLESYGANPDLPDSINDAFVTSLFFDNKGTLWVGTELGLNIINTKTREVRKYENNPLQNTSIAGEAVFDIFQDNKSNIWIGTGSGLSMYDSTNDSFINTRFVINGRETSINSIIQDDKEHLWLSSNMGIIRFSLKDNSYWKFDSDDGVLGNIFCNSSSTKLDNNSLWFGGKSGITIYDNKILAKSKQQKPTVLTSLKILNNTVSPQISSILKQSLPFTKKITFDHSTEMFTISFNTLNYTSPNKIHYAYMLEGYDTSWHHTDSNNRRAVYTHLDGGTYKFKVKSTNSDSIWNPIATELSITIIPPVWDRLWFRLLAVSIIALLIFAAYIYRVKRLTLNQKILENEVTKQTADLKESKKELEEALIAEQEAIEQNQNFIDMLSHEYRTPLSIISTSIDALERSKELNKQATLKETLISMRDASRRLLSIYESSLHNSNINSGKLVCERKNIEIIPVIEGAADYIRHSYQNHKIRIIDNVNPEIHVFSDHQLITTALINILENACKYSAPSTVTIKLIESSKLFTIEISDSGRGISDNEKYKVFEKYYRGQLIRQKSGTGVGLYLVKEIVRLHEGSIDLVSSKNKGTTIIINLPVRMEENE